MKRRTSCALLLATLTTLARAQDPSNASEPPAEALAGFASEPPAEALARYASEPTIQQLLAALEGLAELDPEVARRAARRARRGGWLPDLRLAIRRGQARDLSAQFDAGDDRTRVSTDDDLALEGSLTIRLSRAVYGRDEVALLREERAREQQREVRARLVVSAYFERRRLQLERDLRGRRDLETHQRIAELEALLDAFTAGAFTRIMRDRP